MNNTGFGFFNGWSWFRERKCIKKLFSLLSMLISLFFKAGLRANWLWKIVRHNICVNFYMQLLLFLLLLISLFDKLWK